MKKLAELLPKNFSSSQEILKEIYEARTENYYKFRLMESSDPDEFAFKLESLNATW